MTATTWGRRDFLRAAAAAGLAGIAPKSANAEPAPETTRIRLGKVPSICIAPQFVAEDLLRAEGFSDIQYVTWGGGVGGLSGTRELGAGQLDITMNFAAPLVVGLDREAPISVLAGIHTGCFELFATQKIRTITDLKGKRVNVLALESAQHIFLASIATSVGLDPRRDIEWVTRPGAEAKLLLADGKIDAYLGFPPDPQELRAKHIGHVVLNSATDRPWSQYFCCMVAANREFTQKNPIATKRALRAIIKGSEICATDPDRGAKAYLDQGFATSPEHARQALREIPYGHWREYNPEDTLRFYALRLREAGMVNSPPQKIISHGTDWHALDQLKQELKV